MAAVRLLPLLLLLASCAVSTRTAPIGGSSSAWVWILTGPRDAEVAGAARAAAFAGHFANMERMADAGELLLAGPFGEPRARPDQRGVFVLATADLAEAQAVAATDPTAQAGIFRFELESFRSSDRLAQLGPMHAAAVEASGVAEPPPGFHCRPYLLVTGTPTAAAERALAELPVLFAGRIGADQRALACLDARTADEARALLADGVEWTVMPWFATEEIARLRVSP
jgi:uncharacterized protein YciI